MAQQDAQQRVRHHMRQKKRSLSVDMKSGGELAVHHATDGPRCFAFVLTRKAKEEEEIRTLEEKDLRDLSELF